MNAFIAEIYSALHNAFEDTYEATVHNGHPDHEGNEIHLSFPDLYVTILPRGMSAEERTGLLCKASDKRAGSLQIDLETVIDIPTQEARAPHVQDAAVKIIPVMQELVLELMTGGKHRTSAPSMSMYYVALDIVPSREFPAHRLSCALQVYKINLV